MDKEQLCNVLRREINIVDYARSIGMTPVETPTWHNVTHRLKEHSSVRINADENIFYRNSTLAKGGIIDFCMEFGDGHGTMSQGDAIRHLRQVLTEWNPASLGKDVARPEQVATKTKAPEAARMIELPARSESGNRRLFSYLVKTRCLDAELVQTLVRDGLIYQDRRSNVVFCGHDYDGEIKCASLRTTNTDVVFRGDVSGSSKEVGFSINLIGKAPQRLFVSESAIDAMSLASLVKKFGTPPLQECAFLSLGGLAESPIKYHLPKQPSISAIYLCHDNDEAGNAARSKARTLIQHMGFQGRIIDKPSKGKDFNDDLRELTRSARVIQNQQSQSIERGIQHELS